MTCSACSSGLEKYLNKQKGIQSANVNLVLSIATIEYENLSKKEIEKFIQNAGFESLGEFKGIESSVCKLSCHYPFSTHSYFPMVWLGYFEKWSKKSHP